MAPDGEVRTLQAFGRLAATVAGSGRWYVDTTVHAGCSSAGRDGWGATRPRVPRSRGAGWRRGQAAGWRGDEHDGLLLVVHAGQGLPFQAEAAGGGMMDGAVAARVKPEPCDRRPRAHQQRHGPPCGPRPGRALPAEHFATAGSPFSPIFDGRRPDVVETRCRFMSNRPATSPVDATAGAGTGHAPAARPCWVRPSTVTASCCGEDNSTPSPITGQSRSFGQSLLSTAGGTRSVFRCSQSCQRAGRE